MSNTLTLTAAASTTDVNTDQLVTNNSAVDIVVLDAGGEDTGIEDASAPILIMYEQALDILAPKDGAKVIEASHGRTVTLNDMYTDPDDKTKVYSTSYELIMARADCLYPVKSTHARYILKSKTYTPITISADDATNLKLAENFLQTLMAYPSSTTAQNYQAALSGTTNTAGSTGDIDTAVSAFFATTKGFQALTLNMVTAVQTYYSQYPYVWANYQGSKTYYLYNSDGQTINSLGSVQIKVPTVVPAVTDKTLKGFTITYSDATGKQQPLYYSNGQFVDSLTSDIPGICLMGTFVQKSTLTKVDTDTMIFPILTGTIHQKNVLGYDEQQKQDNDGNWSGMYTILHPKDLMGWVTLFMTATGIFMGLEMVGKGLKSLYDRITKKKSRNPNEEDPSPSEVEDMRTKVKEGTTRMEENYQKLLDKMDKNLEITQDLSKQMEDFQQKVTDQLNEDQRSTLEDSLQTANDAMDPMLDYGNPQSMKNLSKEIDTNYTKIDGATTAELPATIPEVKAKVLDINVNLKIEITRVKTTATQELKDSLDEAQQQLDDAEKASDKIDESAKDNENGETPEDMDFQPHEFQPGIFD